MVACSLSSISAGWRRVWRKTMAAVSSRTAPAWCAAASGIGTTSSKVEIPERHLQDRRGQQNPKGDPGRTREGPLAGQTEG